MNELSEVISNELLQRSIALAVTAGIVFVILRIVKPASARAHRGAWCLVLLQGLMVFQFTIPLPWLKSTEERRIARIDDHTSKTESTDTEKLQPVRTFENVPEKSQPTNDIPITKTEPVTRKSSSPKAVNVPIATSPQEIHTTVTLYSWQSWLIVVWLSGIAVLILRWIYSYVRFVRSLSKTWEGEAPAEPKSLQHAQWQTEWQHLLKERNVQEKIALTIHKKIGPILCRVPGCYQVVVPRKLWESLSEIERRSILEHELAHYQRSDIWKSLAMRVLSLPHWFNPCSWLAVRAFDEAAEWACDDMVRKRNPESHVSFARTLMQLVEFDTPSNALHPAAFGSSISFRVKRLLSNQQLKDSKMKKTLTGLFALAILVLCLVRPQLTEGDTEKDSSTKSPEEKVVQKKVEQKKETRPKVPLSKLRYDEKTFAEWHEILRTDISPDQRKKAIRAFGAFGANGHPRKAAEAIVEVADYYDFSRYSSRKGALQQSWPTVGLVSVSAFREINKPFLIDMSRDLLKRNEERSQWFIIQVIKHRYEHDPKLVQFSLNKKTDVVQDQSLKLTPDLLEVAKTTTGKLRAEAISFIHQLNPKQEGFKEQLVKWIHGTDDETALATCSALSSVAPKAAGIAKRTMEILIKYPSEQIIRMNALAIISTLGDSSNDTLLGLMEVIRDDASNHPKSSDGQFDLHQGFPTYATFRSDYDVRSLIKKIGTPAGKPLLELYKNGNNTEKMYALSILNQMGANAKESVPFFKQELIKLRNKKVKGRSQLESLIMELMMSVISNA